MVQKIDISKLVDQIMSNVGSINSSGSYTGEVEYFIWRENLIGWRILLNKSLSLIVYYNVLLLLLWEYFE